jgi:Flp pilus assembly protein TadD
MLPQSPPQSSLQHSFPRSPASTAMSAIAVALVLGLCGCQTDGSYDITGSLGDKTEKSSSAEPERGVDFYRDRSRANPDDAGAALQYGKALRAAGQKAQAVAVLEQATIAHPNDKALLAGYGRALADAGSFEQAFDVLSRAHTPDNPDWRILSAQGAVLDQLGRAEEARQYYASALKISPDEPSVLSNLGLSYMLSKDLRMAEETLRRAYGHANAEPRVRQNLALVVGLRGHVAEAESILKADRPAGEAAADITRLNRLLSLKANARAQADDIPPTAVARRD